MMEAGRDPREIITPDAFSVAPELLGLPLARPWRRAAAMAIDLVAIAILTGAGWFFLSLGVSFLFFRLAWRSTGGAISKSTRWATFGSLGTVALVVTLLLGWQAWFSTTDPAIVKRAGGSAARMALGDAGATVADVIALSRAETETEFRRVAAQLAERLNRQGRTRDEIEEVLLGIAETGARPWAYDAVETVLRAIEPAPAPAVDAEPAAAAIGVDSLALAYAAAVRSGDSARAAGLQGALVETLAVDRLAAQERRIRRLRAQNRGLEEELDQERDAREEAEERGLIRALLRFADEVGIGFGWSGLYFTLFVTLWRGMTPGKRLMRIRIVRLDGKPIGWWVAFNRFGGYAASIFTGLLGFFEMIWDLNRQALHDRIAATVVVKE